MKHTANLSLPIFPDKTKYFILGHETYQRQDLADDNQSLQIALLAIGYLAIRRFSGGINEQQSNCNGAR